MSVASAAVLLWTVGQQEVGTAITVLQEKVQCYCNV